MSDGSASILVVEDERIVAEDLRECIEMLGHRVVGVATNAEQALDLSKEQAQE